MLIVYGCITPRTLDVVLYGNQKYKETSIEKIKVVKSRLEINEKYFEIGVIKVTETTKIETIKEIASQNGANVIINEGNFNYTLVRYENQKKEDSKNEKSIKT
jgi:hypothetical protein